MTPTIPAPLHPERSAHATIRGYLYQTCLGVLRWIDLKPGEVLVCEGDEDLDRHILGDGSVFEQVKAYSGGLGIADEAVVESLRQFLRSYTTLRPEGQGRRFLFTTTAYRKRSRKGGLDFDLLKAWEEGDRSPQVCAAARSIVLGVEPPNWLAEAVASLDAEPDGWKGFLDAVEWTFDAPVLDNVRSDIRSRLAASSMTRSLPPEAFLDRLVTEVLEASSRPAVRDRLLTRDDLSRLAEAARAELGIWERSEPAVRLRKVFDDLARIGPLLHDNTAELPPNPNPGKLLTAAYEVIPFEEAGRREELEALEAWCHGEEPRSVLLLTGEGGSGKTRLAIEWCRRLRHQGWHAGFLRRDRGKGALDPLLDGVAPRLVVVDYAETRLGVVEPLLYKMGSSGTAAARRSGSSSSPAGPGTGGRRSREGRPTAPCRISSRARSHPGRSRPWSRAPKNAVRPSRPPSKASLSRPVRTSRRICRSRSLRRTTSSAPSISTWPPSPPWTAGPSSRPARRSRRRYGTSGSSGTTRSKGSGSTLPSQYGSRTG